MYHIFFVCMKTRVVFRMHMRRFRLHVIFFYCNNDLYMYAYVHIAVFYFQLIIYA